MNTYDLIITEKTFCGETPIYQKESNSIFWIDTGNPRVFSYNLESKHISSFNLPKPLEGFVPRQKGGWIGPTEDSILFLNKDLKVEKDVTLLLPDNSSLAFHNATAGPDGSMYIGSYDKEDYTAARGCVYRFTPDLQFETLAENIALPNGSGFSPDGTTFYLNEMMASRILAFDFDKSTGSLSNKRIFIEIPPDQGYPDGMTIDECGNLWIALWQGFKIICVNSDGYVIEEIEIPVPSPTCLTFGAEDLKTLFITTAIKGLSEEQLSDYSDSGLLCYKKTRAKGLISKKYEG